MSMAKGRAACPHAVRFSVGRKATHLISGLNQGIIANPQVFNLQRLAVLTTALASSPPDPELIYEAMKDRIHQPYRKTLVSLEYYFR